jgi:hypothetical protein
VQYGIARHAFNARTREVRYAFSPADFGLVNTTTTLPDTYYHPADLSRRIGKTPIRRLLSRGNTSPLHNF